MRKKAIAIVRKYDNPGFLVFIIRNLCHQLFFLGRMEEAIKQIKDLEKIIYSHKKNFYR